MPLPNDGASRNTRSVPRWLFIAAAALLTTRVVFAFFVEKWPDNDRADSGEERTPGEDLVHWVIPDSAEVQSSRSGKPILYDFAAAWCGPCKAMKAELFNDADAALFINSTFVPARIIDRVVEDDRNTPEIEALQKKYKVRAFPTLVIAGADREPVIIEGYPGKEETLRKLRIASASK